MNSPGIGSRRSSTDDELTDVSTVSGGSHIPTAKLGKCLNMAYFYQYSHNPTFDKDSKKDSAVI